MNTIISYITISDADDYFDTNKLDSDAWTGANENDKAKALVQATMIIDRLQYQGTKYDPLNQINEFPRNFTVDGHGSPFIPDDISIACAEIAFSLLDGVNPEEEIKNIYANARTYVNTKIQYERAYIPEYYQAGVPSAVAWHHLLPYLSRSKTININRI